MDVCQWRRCVRLSVAEGALSTAMGTLLSGVFLTAFALSLGATPLHIGVLAAIPPLASVAQLFGARCLNSGVNRKRFCVWSIAASRLVWTAALLIPWFTRNSPRSAILALMAVVCVSSVLGSLGGVASLSWIRDLVPGDRRFGFLGLRNQVNTVLAMVLAMVGAMFLDWWNATYQSPGGGFSWVLVAAILCGLTAIPILNRLDEPEIARERVPSPSAARLPLDEPGFRNLVLFYVCWNLSNHLAAPFVAVVMLKQFGLTFVHIVALQTFSAVLGLVATRYWTRMGERLGVQRVIFLATLGEAFCPLCWALLPSGATWALPLVFLFGVFNTPLAIGAQALVMQIAPDQRASSYLATFNALMGLVTAVAAAGGGYLALWLTHQPPAAGGVPLGGWSLVFLASSAGRFSSLVFLRRLSLVDSGRLARPIVEGRRPNASPAAAVFSAALAPAAE